MSGKERQRERERERSEPGPIFGGHKFIEYYRNEHFKLETMVLLINIWR